MSGLTVTATVKMEGGEWKAEVKAFDLEATGETIEDAVAEITPLIEKYVKNTFNAKSRISAELDGISAKADFTISAISDKSLDDFKEDDEDQGKEKDE